MFNYFTTPIMQHVDSVFRLRPRPSGPPPFPLIMFEFGINDALHPMFNEAYRWLNGTFGETRLVLVVDVREHWYDRERSIAGSESRWDLDAEAILELSPRDLALFIEVWHEFHGVELTGWFSMSVYVCRSGKEPECVLYQYRIPDDIGDIQVDRWNMRLEDIVPVGYSVARDDAESLVALPLAPLVTGVKLRLGEFKRERAIRQAKKFLTVV